MGVQSTLRHDPLSRFLLEKRNYILKEGPIPLQRNIVVTVDETVVASDFVEAEVGRARLWYYRTPSMWWEDVRQAIRRPIRRWNQVREIRRLKSRRAPAHSTMKEALIFDEPAWERTPAPEVIEKYLEQLEIIVNEAESRFSSFLSDAAATS